MLDSYCRVSIILAVTEYKKEKDAEVIRDLNAMPVNARARQLLDDAESPARDESLYCAQAAIYAIEHDMVTVEIDVVETVNAMLDWRPQRIVNFFTLMYIDEYDPPGWKEAADIKEFAECILDDIEHKMVAHFPYYRSPES
jgi:hypothetical protein